VNRQHSGDIEQQTDSLACGFAIHLLFFGSAGGRGTQQTPRSAHRAAADNHPGTRARAVVGFD